MHCALHVRDEGQIKILVFDFRQIIIAYDTSHVDEDVQAAIRGRYCGDERVDGLTIRDVERGAGNIQAFRPETGCRRFGAALIQVSHDNPGAGLAKRAARGHAKPTRRAGQQRYPLLAHLRNSWSVQLSLRRLDDGSANSS